jgi:hypothetical protein
MKKIRLLFLSFSLLIAQSTIAYSYSLPVNINRRIPFLPLVYNNVDKVSKMGSTKRTFSKTEIAQIVKTLDKIKNYESKELPVNHSTPGPLLAVMIKTKDNKNIIIYKDYDDKYKISDWHNTYIIKNTPDIERILKSN